MFSKWVIPYLLTILFFLSGCYQNTKVYGDSDKTGGTKAGRFSPEIGLEPEGSESGRISDILGWEAINRKDVSKDEVVENVTELDFANKQCSRSYAALDSREQEKCKEIIFKLCAEFIDETHEVAGIPQWRPELAPTGLMTEIMESGTYDEVNQARLRRGILACSLYSFVYEANTKVLMERQRLKEVYEASQKGNLTKRDKEDKENLVEKYRVDERATWDELFAKVDVIPPSIIFSIAAKESGWMTSRFAREANNLFGRHKLAGCKVGVECLKAKGDSSVHVTIFSTLAYSVENQIHYLNSHPKYPSFRTLRSELREKSIPLDGRLMSKGLLGYSETGQKYITGINEIMVKDAAFYVYDATSFYSEDPLYELVAFNSGTQ